MTLELIHQAALGRLRGEWDDLVLGMAVLSPFLRTWWLDHMAIGEAGYLLAIDGGRLVGGLPLQVLPWYGVAKVQLLGQGPLSPTFGDVVASPNRKREVAGLVVEWLAASRPPWRQHVVDIEGFYSKSTLAEALQGSGHPVSRIEVVPFAEVGPDRPAYLASRPSQLRKSLRHSDRRFSKLGVTFNALPDEAVESGLETLRELHELRWGEDSSFLPSWQRFKTAALAGAAAGEVEVAEVVGPDGTTLASTVFLRLGTRLLAYQSGRVPTSNVSSGAGIWLYWEELLAQSDVREFDLGPGGQRSKRMWQTGERMVCGSRFAAGAIAGSLLVAARARSGVMKGARNLPSMPAMPLTASKADRA